MNESSGVVVIILIASLGKYLRLKIKLNINSTGDELIDKFFGALKLNMYAIFKGFCKIIKSNSNNLETASCKLKIFLIA